MRQEDILRLEIAMYDSVTLQQDEAAQQLLCKAPDKLQGKSSEFVSLDELVQVHSKKLSRNAQVTAKVETLHKFDHAVSALGILIGALVFKHGIHIGWTHPFP